MKKINFNGQKNVISAQVRAIRKRSGLKQWEVVARLQTMNVNIDQHAYSSIEHNKRMVTDYELACLCRALHVTERELLADFYDKYPE